MRHIVTPTTLAILLITPFLLIAQDPIFNDSSLRTNQVITHSHDHEDYGSVAEEVYERKAFSYEISYIGDVASNLRGGNKTGFSYMGMANLKLMLDTERAGLWKGGEFFMNASNIHATKSLAELMGDFQVASNIDAGNHTYLQEFWLRQVINNVEITVGLQDLNAEFAASEYGGLYLNSSFGILPVISANIAAPIFPLTTLGLTVKWNTSSNSAWLFTIHDGCPNDFENNPYNLKWHFNTGDGMIAVSEFHYTADFKGLEGIFKAGMFSYNHLIEKSFNKEVPDSIDQHICGFYLMADQKLWQQNNRSLGIFTQLGYTPSVEIVNEKYVGLGFNYTGLMCKEGNDILGLAVAHASFTGGLKSETAIELTYQYQVTKNIFLQPDLQYVIQPAAGESTLSNSFAGILRFGLSL